MKHEFVQSLFASTDTSCVYKPPVAKTSKHAIPAAQYKYCHFLALNWSVVFKEGCSALLLWDAVNNSWQKAQIAHITCRIFYSSYHMPSVAPWIIKSKRISVCVPIYHLGKSSSLSQSSDCILVLPFSSGTCKQTVLYHQPSAETSHLSPVPRASFLCSSEWTSDSSVQCLLSLAETYCWNV